MKLNKLNSPLILIITVILIGLGSGCVYYNTFYHAKEKYNQAYQSQRKTSDGKANDSIKKTYEEAIKKASKVLTFYPDSKYADDALYLIGKAYYNTEEWRKADRKFKELTVSFPNSEYAEEADFLLGMCSFNLENYDQAEVIFQDVISKGKKGKYKDDAAFMLGEMAYVQESYPSAIESFKEMLTKYPKSDIKAKAKLRIGECLMELKNYSEALASLKSAEKSGPDSKLEYEISYNMGECLYKLGKYEDGLKIFKSLEKNQKYYDKIADIKLKVAEGYHLQNKLDEAIKSYESITLENPHTEQSAQAYYKMGLIYEAQGELKKANEAYSKGKGESRDSKYAELCVNKSSEITKLESYRTTLSNDSTGGETISHTLLLLAEAMLMDFSQPDSAVKEYKRILKEFPGSDEAKYAYYALGYIYRNIKGDTSLADSFYIELAGRYPDTPFGLEAANILGITEALPDSLNIERMFRLAEKELLEENDPDSARKIYIKIKNDHPGTDYAAHAAYAAAYVLDYYICPQDSSVIYAYQDIIKKYPDTDYSKAAKIRLGLTSRKVKRKKLGELVEEDTSKTFNPEDTTTYENAGFKLAPEPDNKAPLEWPNSIKDMEYRGMVVLKFYVDIFGAISKVELLTTSGIDEVDDAVVEAMMKSSYNAQNMKTEDLNRFYIYRYQIVSPAEERKRGGSDSSGGGGGGGPGGGGDKSICLTVIVREFYRIRR